MTKTKEKDPCKACLQAEKDIEALEAERDAYREAGARVALKLSKFSFQDPLTEDECVTMIDKEVCRIMGDPKP